ncbi:MAG: MBL fold metallo-hydrolase [Anaerovoracaceae bacterium]
MKIKFCGAAVGVTGSCHLVTSGEHKILLDCGQFQGGKAQEELNFEEFPFDPKEIECVVLSHAHIDHCGRLPLLVKRGFKGKIYCTDATGDLLEIMLKDSGYIHEKEAEWKNRKNQRMGRPLIEPLYTFNDSVETLKYINSVRYDQMIQLNENMRVVFNDAGHILGSAIIELWIKEGDNEKKIVFSGDIGVNDRPILRNPTQIKSADVVIMETTYGDRLHPAEGNGIEDLIEIIIKTYKRGGSVIIPSFAVGRTQELIYELNKYFENSSKYKKELGDLTVYIDSPMATNATEVFKANAQVFDEEAKGFLLRGDNPLDFVGLKFTKTTKDSQWLNTDKEPKVIISASGMCEAGRIRHHLKHNLWNSKASIVFVGYQAEGTLGRNIINGQKEVVLFGEDIHINAEIHNLEGFSGHADKDGLLDWVSGFKKKPSQIFLVHGEMIGKEAFAKTLNEQFGYDPIVVTGYTEYEIDTGKVLGQDERIEKEIHDEEIMKIKGRIAVIHNDLEKVLYNASLSIGSDIDEESLTKVRNQLLEIEKGTMSLSSAIATKKE